MKNGPAVEDLLRHLALRVLAALVGRYGDLADAEDAVQEALISAASRWTLAAYPIRPAAG